ncbi:hypothetical protein LOC68_07390 [Blastopirellula sp. JC732]|uniref:Uncharacterized protein n=1 Tax=Blastopirellula sediminis TaxID=2894196 RepID=A0A9X1SIM9_9BACT|nr:hypothetical protein [Blastopirellula sediminis]MCC9609009.1 hypothetical protein [Blastopirellula sediminis]MCC9628214.1 hypothetical protein [Blastopirellula sediminis]
MDSCPDENSEGVGRTRQQRADKRGLPVQFEFEDKAFIVDVTLFLDLNDPANFDHENNRSRVARNGDGFFLFVDLKDEKLGILQEEFGDVDFPSVTLFDLLKARWTPI